MYKCMSCRRTFNEPREISAEAFYGDCNFSTSSGSKVEVCPYCEECGIKEVEDIEFESNDAGVCPFCSSEYLEYDEPIFQSNYVLYPWDCGDCGASGHEKYKLEFLGHKVSLDGECVDVNDYF